jgi:hypothetical protein
MGGEIAIFPTRRLEVSWAELRSAILRESGVEAARLWPQPLKLVSRAGGVEATVEDDSLLDEGHRYGIVLPTGEYGVVISFFRRKGITRPREFFGEFIPKSPEITIDKIVRGVENVGYFLQVGIKPIGKLPTERVKVVSCVLAEMTEATALGYAYDGNFRDAFSLADFRKWELPYFTPIDEE